MKKTMIALAALVALGAMGQAAAQTTTREDTDLLTSQAQTDKRAVLLDAMQMTDDQVRAFTPIFDAYQAEMKELSRSTAEMLNKFAANYGSMTEDAAEDILKDWLELRDERNDTIRKYAKQMGRALPATKVLQWVQIEHKLNALLDVQAASVIRLAR